MSLGYRIAYALGIRPWERAGRGGSRQFAALLDRETSERGGAAGRALDLGCGTGAHTVELAERGWQAVGVDNVPRAIAAARRRDGADTVRFLQGDVTRLDALDVGGPVDLFLDIGCFHGLADDQRQAMAVGVTKLAAEHATLLMLAFESARPPLPRGARVGEVTAAFDGWDLVDDQLADTSGMPGPLKRTAPHWYRLRRR